MKPTQLWLSLTTRNLFGQWEDQNRSKNYSNLSKSKKLHLGFNFSVVHFNVRWIFFSLVLFKILSRLTVGCISAAYLPQDIASIVWCQSGPEAPFIFKGRTGRRNNLCALLHFYPLQNKESWKGSWENDDHDYCTYYDNFHDNHVYHDYNHSNYC